MKKWWRRFKRRFLEDEAFFVGCVRAVVVPVSTGGLVFAQQVAEVVGADAVAVKVIRGVSLVAMGFALFRRAGDKNEPDAKLRVRLVRLGVQLPPAPPAEPGGSQ